MASWALSQALGADSAKAQERLAKEHNIDYKTQTTLLSSEVQRLKAASADASGTECEFFSWGQ